MQRRSIGSIYIALITISYRIQVSIYVLTAFFVRPFSKIVFSSRWVGGLIGLQPITHHDQLTINNLRNFQWTDLI